MFMMISNESFFAAQPHVCPSADRAGELQQPAPIPASNATPHPIVSILFTFFMVEFFNKK
jgi:hypothetical protein